MKAKQLVYVHGAGKQDPPGRLKRVLDTIVFGHEVANTCVAYYANVRWPVATPGAPRSLAAGAPGGIRRQAIQDAASGGVSARDAAAAVVAAAMITVPRRGSLRAASVAPPAAPPADALRLVESLYERADAVARRSAASPPRSAPASLGPAFPDVGFRLVVGWLASDVVDYLFNGYADQMREPVRRALRQTPRIEVLVAHSLGTIVLYDVLSEPEFENLDIELLVTAGSPLGIGNVQERLRDGVGPPSPVPPHLAAWANFADRWDPVAMEATLCDEFWPPASFIRDEEVNNPARNNHDLTGYLSVDLVRSAIVTAVGTA